MEEKRQAKCCYFGANIKKQVEEHRCGCSKCKERVEAGKRYCACIVESNEDLAFFEAKPDEDFDKFFCGCLGWD